MARKTHGLSVREAAEHLGISPRALSAIERDPRPGEDGPLYWDLVNFYAGHELSGEQRERIRHQLWADHVDSARRDGRLTWGMAVRALRGIYGLSVEHLGDQAGATEGTITRLEAGDRRLSDSLQQRIASVPHVEAEVLFPEPAGQLS